MTTVPLNVTLLSLLLFVFFPFLLLFSSSEATLIVLYLMHYSSHLFSTGHSSGSICCTLKYSINTGTSVSDLLETLSFNNKCGLLFDSSQLLNTIAIFNVNKTLSIHLARGINHYCIITWTISICHHTKLDHNRQMLYIIHVFIRF